jgi:uncharacterized membrane protein
MDSRFLARAAVIAALYAALTLAVAPFSFGLMQVRISEALCVLPYFTAAAIPGLFVGCLVANAIGAIFGLGAGVADILFGSLATLAAACLTRIMPSRYLAPLPPVVVNAAVVGLMFHTLFAYPLAVSVLWVGLGELTGCYGLGLPLMLLLEKHKGRLFGE